MKYETECFLRDCGGEGKPPMKMHVTITDEAIYIQPHGHECPEGDYPPVLLEVCGGEARVIVWDDINDLSANPKILPLTGARIENRRHFDIIA